MLLDLQTIAREIPASAARPFDGCEMRSESRHLVVRGRASPSTTSALNSREVELPPPPRTCVAADAFDAAARAHLGALSSAVAPSSSWCSDRLG